jgi:hypothetical protein
MRMVTRRNVIAMGGAAAMTAVGAGTIAVDAKKKTKKVTKKFSNSTAIASDGGGTATPYPSTIQVSGLKKGKILKIRVFLNDFSTDIDPGPDDLDILLSASQLPGLTALIMSDGGGAQAANNVNLILDDAAANSLPDDGPLVSGTFKPTNASGTAKLFPSPAPTSSANSALSVFNGGNPNGTWQLWVNDAAGNGPSAFAGGWSIEITAKVKKKKKKK